MQLATKAPPGKYYITDKVNHIRLIPLIYVLLQRLDVSTNTSDNAKQNIICAYDVMKSKAVWPLRRFETTTSQM